MDNINNLYQELIIDHGTEPRNCHVMPNSNHDAEGFNPLCGDKIHVYLLLDNDIIKDISFISKGCAISTASASIMSEILMGKTLQEAQNIFLQFQHLLTTEDPAPSGLGKLIALAGVREFPSRVKCATLAWHTFKDAAQLNKSRENHD
jgi:nitrogen fixation protein NifU and related proteins